MNPDVVVATPPLSGLPDRLLHGDRLTILVKEELTAVVNAPSMVEIEMGEETRRGTRVAGVKGEPAALENVAAVPSLCRLMIDHGTSVLVDSTLPLSHRRSGSSNEDVSMRVSLYSVVLQCVDDL